MNRILIVSILILSLAGCATTTSQPASSLPLWAGLAPGQYPIGFISSTLPADPHPLQVNIWYPSQTDGKQLHYRDYLTLNLVESATQPATSEAKQKALDEAKKFLTSNGVSAASADALFNAPMYARANARVTTGKFPLVFVVQGSGQSASGQAVLSEFLASQGFVVVTIPSITRVTGPMKTEDDIAPKAEAEMADIQRALASLAQWPNIDTAVPVAFVAHSFGARSALMYAMHHPTSAIVSLEGGIGTATGQKAMVNSKVVDLTAPMPPILHFYELNDDRVTPDFRLLRSLKTPDLQTVRFNSLRHVHFSSDGFASVMLPEMARATKAGPDLKQELQAVANQTLAFIRKYTERHPTA